MTNIALSSLPIVTLVVFLTALKRPAWQAALAAAAVTALEAFFFFNAAPGAVAAAAAKGVQTGVFPIGLVITAALFTYGVSVESGAMEEIKHALSSLSDDKRYLALLMAWGFGNFMEGMAGFGTAVAIPCAILVGIGFDPMKAVLCCLVANTTPTAFGSVGVPTAVLASETGLDLPRLSTLISFLQCLPTALSPFLILVITDGRRGLAECWRLAAVASGVFIVPWILAASTIGCELPDVIGGIAAMAAFAAMGRRGGIDIRRQLWAWQPFAYVVIALATAAALPPAWKPSPGFVILAAAFLGAVCQRVSPLRALCILFGTVRRYILALLTICTVLAVAKVMGEAGMTKILAGALVNAAGTFYAGVSASVGALAGFVTGSGTSSNVLFGSLQASVGSTDFERFLYAAANVMGAGIGKMICPQSIVLGCAAAGLAGRESEVMRRAAPYFAIVLAAATICTTAFAILH